VGKVATESDSPAPRKREVNASRANLTLPPDNLGEKKISALVSIGEGSASHNKESEKESVGSGGCIARGDCPPERGAGFSFQISKKVRKKRGCGLG